MIAEPLSGFSLSVNYDEGLPVLHVTGEVDLATAPELQGVIAGLLERSDGELVLDLHDLRFMDARGLGVIAQSGSASHAGGGLLTVRGPNRLIRWLLQLTDLGEGVRVEDAQPDDGVGMIADAARIPANQDVVRTALLLVVSLAEAALPGADKVTLSLAPHGPLVDVVAVDREIAVLDRDQYAVGEGPCRSAAEEAEQFHIRSIDHEDRWPAFVPLARARGVNSILSTPVPGASRAVGALNMYSFQDRAFSDQDQHTAHLLAQGAAAVLDRSGGAGSTAALESRVRDAMGARHNIAMAQGILVGRERLSADEAFTALLQESKRTSQPLRDVAARIAATAEGGASDDPDAV